MLLLFLVFAFAVPIFEGQKLPLEFLTDVQKRNLEVIDFQKLPVNVQNVVRDYREVKEGDQWCCKIKAVKSILATSSQLVYHTVSQPTRYTKSCGFLGLSRCTRYRATYSRHAMYRTIYHRRTVPTTCPDNQLTCCKDHVLVANSCIPISRIPEVHQDLINLAHQQLLG